MLVPSQTDNFHGQRCPAKPGNGDREYHERKCYCLISKGGGVAKSFSDEGER